MCALTEALTHTNKHFGDCCHKHSEQQCQLCACTSVLQLLVKYNYFIDLSVVKTSANSNLKSIFPECHHHSPLPQSTAERAGLHVVVMCEIAAVDTSELSGAHRALGVICRTDRTGDGAVPAHTLPSQLTWYILITCTYGLYENKMKPVTALDSSHRISSL